jgi:hypothetical protein
MSEDVTELREQAELVGIADTGAMSAEQLKVAIAERHRGLDPAQAREVATGIHH